MDLIKKKRINDDIEKLERLKKEEDNRLADIHKKKSNMMKKEKQPLMVIKEGNSFRRVDTKYIQKKLKKSKNSIQKTTNFFVKLFWLMAILNLIIVIDWKHIIQTIINIFNSNISTIELSDGTSMNFPIMVVVMIFAIIPIIGMSLIFHNIFIGERRRRW